MPPPIITVAISTFFLVIDLSLRKMVIFCSSDRVDIEEQLRESTWSHVIGRLRSGVDLISRGPGMRYQAIDESIDGAIACLIRRITQNLRTYYQFIDEVHS